MTRLDDELAREVAKGDDEGALPVAAPLAPASHSAPRAQVGLLIGVLAVCGVVLGLVFSSSKDSGMLYSLVVDEAVAQRASLGERNLRVQGLLVSGTLTKRDNPCEYRFKMHKNGETIDVHYPQCVVPDTFRDVKGVDVEVTAEGRFASDGHLAAESIFAKCPSKYDMQQQVAEGIAPPHAGQPEMIPPRQM